MSMQRVLAAFLAVALVSGPVSSLRASDAVLGRVIPRSSAQLNGITVFLESTVFSGDIVDTPPDSFAVYLLANGNQLQLGPASEVRLLQVEVGPLAVLERGAVLVRSDLLLGERCRGRGDAFRGHCSCRESVLLGRSRESNAI